MERKIKIRVLKWRDANDIFAEEEGSPSPSSLELMESMNPNIDPNQTNMEAIKRTQEEFDGIGQLRGDIRTQGSDVPQD